MASLARPAFLRRTLPAFFLLPLLAAAQQPSTLAAGVPLHIRITRTAHMKVGAAIRGTLTQPVYLVDRLALPVGSVVRGNVQRLIPADHNTRLQAHLNGDVTPLHQPILFFDRVTPPGALAPITLSAHGRLRDTQFLRFVPRAKKPSLVQQGVTMVKARINEARAAFFAPGKKDRALRLLYSQLPYHPQRIWAGAGVIAELDAPAALNLAPAAPTPRSTQTSLDNLRVDARLANDVTSATARKGDPITAIVTRPLFDSDHRLIIPQGARLDGIVAETRSARRLGRNGQLRLGFRGIEGAVPVNPSLASLHGTITAAEGEDAAHVTVDREGNVQAHPARNRFVAPLLLALTAAKGNDSDGNSLADTSVASNGFGVVARVIALTAHNRPTAVGFGVYALAKSVYFRFLTRGHDVTFPQDTLIEVQLSERTEGTPAPR
jgi:hypothetical protein